MSLPTDANARKNVPLFAGLIRYFPDALAAVAECSKKGNDQHNPGSPLHWDRSKSTDELEALSRHLWEVGTLDNDGIRHSAKVAWRALANLQKEIEADAKVPEPAPEPLRAFDDNGQELKVGDMFYITNPSDQFTVEEIFVYQWTPANEVQIRTDHGVFCAHRIPRAKGVRKLFIVKVKLAKARKA